MNPRSQSAGTLITVLIITIIVATVGMAVAPRDESKPAQIIELDLVYLKTFLDAGETVMIQGRDPEDADAPKYIAAVINGGINFDQQSVQGGSTPMDALSRMIVELKKRRPLTVEKAKD